MFDQEICELLHTGHVPDRIPYTCSGCHAVAAYDYDHAEDPSLDDMPGPTDDDDDDYYPHDDD
jgi:hypothetical protein